MIVTEVGNKKKINLPYDLKVYLGKITEYAKYSIYNENLFFDMNKSGMSQSDLYPNNPSVDVNSKRTRKDSDRDREKMSLGMNSKLTDRNPNLYTQTIYDIFNQEFDIDMNGITENALWLTSYAYEFFFITMVEVELMSGAEKIGNQVRNVNEVTDSFARLKKGFELLFYPVVLAEGYNDFIGDVTKAYWGSENKLFNIGTSIVTYDGIDAIKESISKLAKSRVSEGFVSFEYGDVVYSGKNNPTDVYDAYPMLATFFVKLFIADAQKLLSKALLSKDKRDKYDFSKNDIRSSEQHGLLKFYLTDFMPIVIDKIQYLLDKSDNSGAGFELYKQIMNTVEKEYPMNQEYLEKNATLIPLRMYQLNGISRWESFEDDVNRNAKLYFDWSNKQSNQDCFDLFSNNPLETSESILGNFKDTRTKKGHKEALERTTNLITKFFNRNNE